MLTVVRHHVRARALPPMRTLAMTAQRPSTLAPTQHMPDHGERGTHH